MFFSRHNPLTRHQIPEAYEPAHADLADADERAEPARSRGSRLLGLMRRHLRRAAYHAIDHSGAARLARRRGGAIFCYHNIVPDELAGRVGDPSLHLGRSRFADQLDWITRWFTVVPLSDLVERLRQGRRTTGLAALTFDDAYVGALNHAVPLMRALSVPFALFPVVHAADDPEPFWWDMLGSVAREDRERILAQLRGDARNVDAPATDLPADLLPASWDLLRARMGGDCTVGSHTMRHRNLSTLEPADITWELEASRTRLTAELGITPDILAYPYGLLSDIVRSHAARAGYVAGLTLEYGLTRPGADLLRLGRVNIPGGIEGSAFACWASGLKVGR